MRRFCSRPVTPYAADTGNPYCGPDCYRIRIKEVAARMLKRRGLKEQNA